MTSPSDSDLIFLGLYERAAYVRDGNTNLFKWNVLGLKNIVVSSIFPLPLKGVGFCFALKTSAAGSNQKVIITDDSKNEVGFVDISMRLASPKDEDALLKKQGPMIPVPMVGWMTLFCELKESKIVILKPGIYFLQRKTQRGSEIIGQLHFALITPPPLTPERIAAIRSEPKNTKAARIELGCINCVKKFRAYTALEKNQKLEDEGNIWYQDLPESFICECGKTQIDLAILRKNFHAILGQNLNEVRDKGFLPEFEISSIKTIRKNFFEFLNADSKEELLQKFIEENPVLLHQFPATRIFFKPPILTKYVGDFGILTPKKELVLIEIEKTTTRLMRNNGDTAADLNHAFDQVQNWLHHVDEHRLAFLDSLNINKDEVSIIIGVVIAGRDKGYDAEQLRKLKGVDRGKINLLTYDDLLFALDALIGNIDSL